MLASFALLVALSHAPPKDLVVAEQPVHELHVKIGQKLVFSVLGNASTGGMWSVKISGKPGLKYLGMNQVDQPQTKPPIVGQGATYLIKFMALRKGIYRLKLIYGQSWEIAKGAKPWDQRTAKVVIR